MNELREKKTGTVSIVYSFSMAPLVDELTVRSGMRREDAEKAVREDIEEIQARANSSMAAAFGRAVLSYCIRKARAGMGGVVTPSPVEGDAGTMPEALQGGDFRFEYSAGYVTREVMLDLGISREAAEAMVREDLEEIRAMGNSVMNAFFTEISLDYCRRKAPPRIEFSYGSERSL